ncbi:MAG TPA: DNA-binding domain-containing protein [Variovorax sp.]|nr:DNA-binding domain-containing protein [Variovorax sp.]
MNASTSTTLASFQEDFARALFDSAATNPLQAQPAFAVYRNTVMKGCIDALEANYPSVSRLVGRDWFRSAAALYVAGEPPTDGALVDYGGKFADFLRDFAPAAGLPYLPDVARLDRCWTEAHIAADAPPLSTAELARLSPHELCACRLQPHPAARWAWFEEQPIYSIWQRNRLPEDSLQDGEDIAWHAEGALLTRPSAMVRWQAAGLAECAFLDACARGCRLAEATEHALDADPTVDLMALLATLMQAGALAAPPHIAETGACP